MNKNDIKKLAAGVSVHEETCDHCAKCQELTPIADINLSSGECFLCHKPKRKFTEAQLRELLKLDVGLI